MQSVAIVGGKAVQASRKLSQDFSIDDSGFTLSFNWHHFQSLVLRVRSLFLSLSTFSLYLLSSCLSDDRYCLKLLYLCLFAPLVRILMCA